MDEFCQDAEQESSTRKQDRVADRVADKVADSAKKPAQENKIGLRTALPSTARMRTSVPVNSAKSGLYESCSVTVDMPLFETSAALQCMQRDPEHIPQHG